MELFFNPLLAIKLTNMTRYLLGALLLSWKLPRREHFWQRFLLWSGFCYGVMFAIPVLTDHIVYVTTIFLVGCILSIGVVKLCWKTDWRITLFIASAVFSCEHIASMLDSIIALVAPQVLNYARLQHMTPWILLNYTFWYGAVLGIVYHYVFRKLRLTDHHSLSMNAMLLLTVISLVVNLYINIIYSNLVPERGTAASLFEYIINIICSGFLLKIQVGMLRENQMETRLQMTSMLWEQAREQYRISKENVEAINMKCHDLKHRLLAVEGLSKDEHFADIMETIDSYGSEIETNNEVLNVVFQEKNFQCRKLGIQFTCIIDGAALNGIETTDLYVLFGNLIDNCIEAVSQLEEGQVKNIQVTVRREKGFVIISTENGYVGQLKWYGGRLRTSKDDKRNHGYGMLSIGNIVHKYGGRYSIKTEDQVFYMSIVLPLQQMG